MSNLKTSNKFYIWCIAIIASNFFGLYNIASKYTQVYFTTAISFLLCIISLFIICVNIRHVKYRVSKKRKVDRYVALFLIWIVIECFVSLVKYSETQSIIFTIKESLFCFAIVCLYYALNDIIKHRTDFEFLVDVLIKVSIVCSVLAIVALEIYSRTGNNIMGLDVENYSFIRNNRGHFMIGEMVVIPATVFLWCRLITGKYSFWNIIVLVLNLIHIVYVGQTRMVISIVLTIMVLSYLVVSKRSKKFKILIFILLLIMLVVWEIQTIKNEFYSLLIDNSVSYRLSAIEFYIDQILHKPIFGMGFISATNNSLSSLLYGPLHRFYRTDVGLIGFVNCLGVLSSIWYVSLLLYAIRMIKNARGSIDVRFFEYVFSYSLLMILCSINLFPIDGFRVIYFPIYMILIRLLERMREKKNIKSA